MPDILELARECGAEVTDYGRGHYVATFGEVSLPELERRIREDEREKAATMAEQWCTPIAERLALSEMTLDELRMVQAAMQGLAAAIRRGGDHG